MKTADLYTILNKYGNSVVTQIRSNLQSTGSNATGKTSSSLRYEVKDDGTKSVLSIFARPYFAAVETGRKATPQFTKPSRDFVLSIKEWAQARGLPEGAAYAIAKSIHQKGTKPTGKLIFSNVINKSLTDMISKEVLDTHANLYVTNIKQIYGRNGN